MSIEALKATMEAKLDNPTKKSVLLGLANHAGPDGSHAYPSVRRLCVYTGLGESTVRTKLSELRADKIIQVVKEFKRYRPTEYKIDLNRLIAMRDPDLQELEGSSSTPTSADNQTSSSEQPDLQQTDTRPTGAGREPAVEPSVKPAIKDAAVAAKHQFLKSKGVGDPARTELSENEKISLEYLEAHFQYGDSQNDSIALIIHRIRSGDKKPEKRSYVAGQFADFWDA